MILTDREIRISVERELIQISPAPVASAYSSTAVDLTLDNQIRVYRKSEPGIHTTVDPGADGYSVAKAIETLTEAKLIQPDGYEFAPGFFLLAWTREAVSLKPEARLAARVEGKSSLARLGVGVHVTAPTIHAGFKGPIQLEMYNHGPLPVVLRTGMKVCQLIFEQTCGVPDAGYSGQFQGQSPSGFGPS